MDDITWSPFATGWFGENKERHYLVSYSDRNGRSTHKYCKTSLGTSVYWKDAHT